MALLTVALLTVALLTLACGGACLSWLYASYLPWLQVEYVGDGEKGIDLDGLKVDAFGQQPQPLP